MQIPYKQLANSLLIKKLAYVSAVIIVLTIAWDRINVISHETLVPRDEVIFAQVENKHREL